MKKIFSYLLKITFLIIIIPYFIVFLFFSPTYCLERKSLDTDELILWILKINHAEKLEEEAIKAETVIFRTNLYKKLEDGKSISEIAAKLQEEAKKKNIYYLSYSECEKFWKSIQETKNVILKKENVLAALPFFYCSAGKTRSGEEVYHDQAYAYLKSIDCEQDLNCDTYLSYRFLSKEQFPISIEVLEQDSAGYVIKLMAGDRIYSGERFAKEMKLASSCFVISETKDGKIIFVKGKGHGLGYSEYGGNELAKKGYSYKEILGFFFPEFLFI